MMKQEIQKRIVELLKKQKQMIEKFKEENPEKVKQILKKSNNLENNNKKKNKITFIQNQPVKILEVKLTKKDFPVLRRWAINMPFKKDFGSYIKNTGLSDNGKIIITKSFTPLSLILYPDGLSSITANINEMIVSFDFRDEVLKIFLYIFQEFKVIDKSLLAKQIQQQTDQPIVISFTNFINLVKIMGVALSCELGKIEISETTSEEFIPLIITKATIVKKPVGVIVPMK